MTGPLDALRLDGEEIADMSAIANARRWRSSMVRNCSSHERDGRRDRSGQRGAGELRLRLVKSLMS